ncbi:hypothetical protein B0H13DRAFT_1877691 [Mycena leptocephala]|nr:hypothetical protein B0H13DRAFT_1877691 [Mycena leptocephala]
MDMSYRRNRVILHDDIRHAATSSLLPQRSACTRRPSLLPPSFLAHVDRLQHNPTSPLVKFTHTLHHRFTMRVRRARAPPQRLPFAVPAEYHHQPAPHFACFTARAVRPLYPCPPLPSTLRIPSISLRRSANAVARTLEAAAQPYSLCSASQFWPLQVHAAEGADALHAPCNKPDSSLVAQLDSCQIFASFTKFEPVGLRCSSFSRKFLEHPARLRPDFTESLVSSTQGFSGYRATSAAFSTSRSARLNQVFVFQDFSWRVISMLLPFLKNLTSREIYPNIARLILHITKFIGPIANLENTPGVIRDDDGACPPVVRSNERRVDVIRRKRRRLYNEIHDSLEDDAGQIQRWAEENLPLEVSNPAKLKQQKPKHFKTHAKT